MTTLRIDHCTLADMPRASDVHMDAMGRVHVFVNEMFPRHWTPEGRSVARQRHQAVLNSSPSSFHHLKITDARGLVSSTATTGSTTASAAAVAPRDVERGSDIQDDSHSAMVGYGRWLIKQPGGQAPACEPPHIEGHFWDAETDKQFFGWLATAFTERRRNAMKNADLDQGIFGVHRFLSALPPLPFLSVARFPISALFEG